MPLTVRRVVLIGCLSLLASCTRAVRVTYDREHCYLDGRAAQISEVEEVQTELGQHVLARQPIQTWVTIVMLLIAGAGYFDKLALLIAARRSSAPSFAERVRASLERHRPHPVRYFGIVLSGLVLIGVGAGCYIWLDADRRASERALQQLQFCHLALKSAEEQSTLDEQRKNLDRLQSTAGSIKSLVDSLPPDEQKKATELLGQMKIAIGNQDRVLGRESALAQAVASGSAEIQQNLGLLAADLGALKGMPDRLRAALVTLERLDGRTSLANGGGGSHEPATLGEALAEVRHDTADLARRVGDIDCTKSRLPTGKTIGETIADLAARPLPTCHCECRAPVEAAPRPDGGTH